MVGDAGASVELAGVRDDLRLSGLYPGGYTGTSDDLRLSRPFPLPLPLLP